MYSDEKLLILKMLEEGKITSEEAVKLLEALDSEASYEKDKGSSKYSSKSKSFQDDLNKFRDRVNDWKTQFKNGSSQKDFDKTIDEFSQKAEKLGKNLAHTTFGIVDKVIDFVGSFVETNSFNMFSTYKPLEKNYETSVFDGMDLKVLGINGHIILKKQLIDDKITINTKIKAPDTVNDNLVMYQQTEKGLSIELNNDNNLNISISHEIIVPSKRFNKIILETSNARIYVEDSVSEVFECTTRNSHIDIMGVNSSIINLTTKNAKVQVNYVAGKILAVNTTNSPIDIKHVKVEQITANTTNSKIYLENIQNFENCQQLDIALQTTNAGIKVNMTDMDNRGYKINAQTSLNGINLLIPDISYSNITKGENNKHNVEANSNNYETYERKVSVTAKTDNGYIEIIK
jgi:DUF4097 and DUF4098 domain-containing protein YvlB